MHHTTLTTATRTIGDNLALVRHLAATVEDLRHTMPEGYGARPDADGIARPVEQIILANEARGVTKHVSAALATLNYAAEATAQAALALDAALTAWSSPSK